MIRVYMDGSSNPNSQTAAVGIILLDGVKHVQLKRRLDHYVDNHEAEFLAFLEVGRELSVRALQNELILVYSDSKLLVDAIAKRYTKKERYQELLHKCLEMVEDFPNLHLSWISEKENKGADHLARQALYTKKQ